MKILITIANHGTGNRQYLDQLISAYQDMPVDVTIVILSNIPKEISPDVEVLVGVPNSNPWSLPFAHRKLFIDRQNDFDFFVYSEDDTLLTWNAIQAFIESTKILKVNEIAGFVRTETAPDGLRHFSTCHSFFHWIPSSVRKRGGDLWAHYTNEHAACYVVSQLQLKIAIKSGGFVTEPHEGRHDMLCAAATDVYTQCGFERLVCLDQIESFIAPHLPNKYIGIMGLPENEMGWQLEALHQVYAKELSDNELLFPESRLPGCMCSKFYQEQPDEIINNMVGNDSKKIFIWGAGDGIFEADLEQQGHNIAVLPLNSVVSESCLHRKITVLTHDFIDDSDYLEKFDIIIFRDVLHLVESPRKLLATYKKLLKVGGTIVIRVPNLYDIGLQKRRYLDSRYKIAWNRDGLGVTPLKLSDLFQLAKDEDLTNGEVYFDMLNKRRIINKLTLGLFSTFLSPYLYLKFSV